MDQLTIGESDYAFHRALVIHVALGLYEGNGEAAVAWLTQPSISLGRGTPASLLFTLVGMKTVEALIWKIQNGGHTGQVHKRNSPTRLTAATSARLGPFRVTATVLYIMI